jgi:protein involved in polysaccharide export with SLBB domain
LGFEQLGKLLPNKSGLGIIQIMKGLCSTLLLACCISLGGCATKRTAALETNHVLRPGDTISIHIDGPEDQFGPEPTFRIDGSGAVTLVLIGAIEIGGLTTTEAATKIHDAYVPKYYPELKIIVRK